MMKHMGWAGIVLMLAMAQQVQAQDNLLRNAGFETAGSELWEAYSWETGNPDEHGYRWGTASRENWRSMSGSWAGAIRGTWSGQGSEGGFWQQAPATPGQRYRFTGWFWADVRDEFGNPNKWTAAEQAVKIEFFTSSLDLISYETLPLEYIPDHWVRKGLEATAPENAAWVRVVIYATGVGGNGALQFDDLELIEVEEEEAVYPGPSTRRTGIVISEIMYNPPGRIDGRNLEFVELHNTTPFSYSLAGHRLSGSIAYDFPSETVLPPFGFLVIAKEPASVETVYGITGVLGPYENRLSSQSGRVRLRKGQPKNPLSDAFLLEVNYSARPPWPLAAAGGGHSLVLSQASYGEDDPRAWSASAVLGGSPGGPEIPVESVYANVVINEFLAHTDPPVYDFIELYNTSDQPIDLSGAMLSDRIDRDGFIIPDDTVIPGHGFVVFYECPERDNPHHTCATNFHFGLSSQGEDVVFRAPDGIVVDAYRFEAQENGVSMGRYPDGAAEFHELTSATPDDPNTALRIRPVVINEIMYNPITRDDNDQYVELHNWSGSPVDVGHWRFVDGISFTIPEGTTIPAGGFLVIAKNAEHLMSRYPGGQLNSGNTVGNFDGNLAKSGERIALARPLDPEQPDRYFIIVDEVTYVDGGRWGEWSNSDGSSIELIDPRSDNRRAANWTDSDESDKGEWITIEHTGVLDHGMREGPLASFNIDELHLVMLRRGQVLVDNVEVRRVVGGVEQENLVANSTFETGLSGWTIQGNMIQSGLANEGYESGQSLHIRATGGGDTGANRIKVGLTSPLSTNDTVVLRAKVRWVRGSPYFLMRLRGNYLEAEGPIEVPANLGTPGLPNSQYAANTGPAIWDVRHHPVLPATDEPVTVTARVHDPDGIDTVQLIYRLDPSATTTTVAMTHAGGGVYSAVIPGQPKGQLVAFHVRAQDAHASPAVSRYPVDVPPGSRPGPGREALVRFGEADPFSAFGSYRFWMTQANLDEWKTREPHSNEHLDTTFVYNGTRVIHNAGIRYRGSPWTRPHLPAPDTYDDERRSAYRVKIPPDEVFLGMDELNLDSLEQDRDPTLQREQAVYRISGDMGLPSRYQRYVFMHFNGIQYPYIYADVHHMDSDYIRTWFPREDDGQLFKIEDWEEFEHFGSLGFMWEDARLSRFETTGGELKKARYRWSWEKRANAGFTDDYSGIFRLVEAATAGEDQYTAMMEAVIDMRQWMRAIALRHVVGDPDGYGFHRGKNMYLYRPNNGRWHLIPWDLDFALGTGVAWDTELFQVWADLMPCADRMMSHPPFRRYLWQAVYDAAHGAMLSSRVNPIMDEMHDALIAEGVAAANPWEPKDWIGNRRGYILQQLNAVTDLNLGITSNNGNDFSTGVNLVTLTGEAPVQIHTILFNGVEYRLTWTSETEWQVTLALSSGQNTIAVTGHDADGNQLESTSINVTYTGDDVPPEGHVIFNEIMYHPADELAEFIELHNASTNYAFDLSGWRLAGVSYDFEQGTVIPPEGYIVLVENVPAFAAVHTNLTVVVGEYSGKLDNSGERLRLLRPDGEGGEILVDQVVYDRLPPWPSEADGQGPSLQLIDPRRDRDRVANWAVDTEVLYTPGAPNSVARELPEFPRVWINEVQPTNTSTIADNYGQYDPWLELFNEESAIRDLTDFWLTDDFEGLDQWQFPAGATAPAEGFRLVWMDGETWQTDGTHYHASFRLSTTGGTVALVYSNAGEVLVVDYVHYPEVPEDQSYGSYPDGDTYNRWILRVPTPGAPNTPLTLASLTELILPRFIQGDQDEQGNNFNRVPYAFRARIENLLPDTTYRYANRVVTDEDPWHQDGGGNMIFARTDGGNFVRTTSSPDFSADALHSGHGEFTTDGEGSYEGWFITEPSGNWRFTPGNTLNMRVLLNDGQGGETIEHSLTTTGGVTVLALDYDPGSGLETSFTNSMFLKNPGFEDGDGYNAYDWSQSGGVQRQTWADRLNPGTDTDFGMALLGWETSGTFHQDHTDPVGGGDYEFSIWGGRSHDWNDPGHTIEMFIEFRDSDNELLDSVTKTDLPGSLDQWNQYFLSGTAPAGTETVRIGVRFYGPSGGGGWFRWDDAELIETYSESSEPGEPIEGDAVGLVGHSYAGPRQFVVLYDNEDGTNRPLAAAFVEVSGAQTDTRYADFYVNEVSGRARRWGTIIPKDLPSGVRRVEERGLIDGQVQKVIYQSSDAWPGTVDPETGMTPIILGDPPNFQFLHYWSFNDTGNLLEPTYSLIEGAALTIDTGTVSVVEHDTGQDFAGVNNRLGENTGAHLRLNNPIGATVMFELPTTGYEDLVFRYETRRSGQGAGTQILEYTVNGSSWDPLGTVTTYNAPPVLHTFDLAGIPGVNNNADFAIRITFEQGEGSTAGNNRFDNVTLDGYAREGVNQPPAATNPIGFLELIEGSVSNTFNLYEVFSDPDGDPLTFGVSSSDPNAVPANITGSVLSVTPQTRGGSTIVVTATDGMSPPVSMSFRVLVYPDAHVLENGNFAFGAWDPDTPERTYPEHMLFLQSDQNDTAIDTPLLYAYHIEHDDYHSNDAGTIGFPYNNTGRSRINGLGENGIAFINTGSGRDLGGALLALDTRNVTEAPVGWLAGTVLANTRVYAIRLQYRVGTTGDFVDVLDENDQPVVYVRQTDGHTQPMDPVNLPAEAMDEEYVQLLWRYYRTSEEYDSGPRAQLRLDDIVVASTYAGEATALAFVDQPHAYWQSGQRLTTVSVRAMDAEGFTDTEFTGTITLGVAGESAIDGDVSVQAVAGLATFNNVTLTGIGTNRLTATSGVLDSGLSSLISLADVTGLIVPSYIQGEQDALGDNNDRIPFAYRAQLEGLRPNATYRYGNRVVTEDDPWDQNGAGNMIFVTGAATDWIRNTDSPRFRDTDLGGRHYEFTTDATGSYTGWFITEPSGNARFTPGNTVWMRILLNDGQDGEDEQHYLTLSDEITVIRFGSEPNEATGIMGQSTQAARNFVYLYDNTDGTNRPLAGVPIEITGSVLDDRYATFYDQVVAVTPQYWGTLIPNTLPTGVRRIEARAIGNGSILSADLDANGIDGTIDPDGGLDEPLLLGADVGIPVFLPGGDGTWDLNASWSTGVYPDGVDAVAIINEPLDADRDIEIFTSVTMGALTVNHADSTNMNRIRTRGVGTTLTFESSSGPAELTINGSGSGFVEFRTEETIILQSDLLITITNINEQHGLEGVLDVDYGALRLRDDWTGPGGLTKAGAGVMTLTGGGKDYTGETIVDFGVLRVTEPASPGNTAGVTVNPGGQLRLVSTGDRVYPFGGSITLESLGRGGDVPGGEELGILGALRYDPGSNDNRAEVTNAVVIAGPTSLHVDGTRNEMDLSGPISGAGAFSKSGGGTLVLSGDSSGYTVPVIVSNGQLRVDGMLGSSVSVNADAEVRGSGTVGALSGSGTVSPGPGAETLTAPSVNGLNYQFRFTDAEASVLRLTGGTPFISSFNIANAVEIFLDVAELNESDVFEGGFFTDQDVDFLASIENADWTFYVRDEEGSVEHEGELYSVYEGELEVSTVSVTVDFGHGPVSGRILRIGPDDEPTGFAAWQQEEFTEAELNDPEISGPFADPDDSGISNLLRYALGLGRYDDYEDALPEGKVDEPGAILRIRRLSGTGTGIAYVILVRDSLTDGEWQSVEMGTDLVELGVTPTGDGITEIVEYEVPDATLETPKYFRLKVILLD